jgi:hypothetical protein
MADNNGSGVGTGLIAGILLVVLSAVGLVVMNGGLNLNGGKDVNIKVETPKVPPPPTDGQ